MAISPRLISLNFGSQTVGLAEFRVQAYGGLVLLDYRLREAPLDPARPDHRKPGRGTLPAQRSGTQN